MTNDQALSYMHNLLRGMLDKKASDLFISADFPPAMKIDGKMTPVTQQKLTGEFTKAFAEALMSEKQRKEFAEEKECNFAIYPKEIGRFRVNVFMQQGLTYSQVNGSLFQHPLKQFGIAWKPKNLIHPKTGL